MEKQPRQSAIVRLIALVVIAIVLVIVLVVVHNNKNTSPSLTAAQTSAAKQQITANWKTFFAAATSLQNREKLLQNGSKFSQPMQSEFTALGSQSSSAVVNSVSLTNSSSANVVYTVELNKQPVLTNQKGMAILSNGTWQVSDATLCQLLALGGSKPAACQNL